MENISPSPGSDEEAAMWRKGAAILQSLREAVTDADREGLRTHLGIDPNIYNLMKFPIENWSRVTVGRIECVHVGDGLVIALESKYQRDV